MPWLRNRRSALGELVVVRRDRAALAGGDRLHRVEGEAAHVGAGAVADRPVGGQRAEGVAASSMTTRGRTARAASGRRAARRSARRRARRRPAGTPAGSRFSVAGSMSTKRDRGADVRGRSWRWRRTRAATSTTTSPGPSPAAAAAPWSAAVPLANATAWRAPTPGRERLLELATWGPWVASRPSAPRRRRRCRRRRSTGGRTGSRRAMRASSSARRATGRWCRWRRRSRRRAACRPATAGCSVHHGCSGSTT